MGDSTPRGYVQETKHRDSMLENYTDKQTDFTSTFDRLAYKLFASWVAQQQEQIETFQSKLKGAQMSIGADMYLCRVVLATVIAVGAGFLLGTMFGAVGIVTGEFAALGGGSGIVTAVLAVTTTVGTATVSMFVVGVPLYIYPSYVCSRRKSAINVTLPAAVTFIYALNKGGMSLYEVMKVLSRSEDAYGEVAVEFQSIVSEMELRSTDMLEALRLAGRRSPSDNFSDFMDDVVGVLDSGAETSGFFSDKADEMLEQAERDQKAFIETLALMGEVYVTAFVAGPLFLIIITVVMSMLGGSSAGRLDAIVYGLLPFMNIAFFFLIDFISGADEDVSSTLPLDDGVNRASDYDVEEFVDKTDDEKVQKVHKEKQRRERMALLRQPVTELLRNPDLTAVFTLPVALIEVILSIATGFVTLSVSGFIDDPVGQTVALVLLPLFTVSIPLLIFHEIKTYRESRLMGRFPDALKTLASNNSVGMTLTEALEKTAQNTSGRLGTELSSVRNDIQWNHDVNRALKKFANRLRIPILTRTVKLITQANESTGDIEDVLDVAAKNVQAQKRLKKERSQEMMMYTAVILISFAVYLFVIFLLDQQFLTKIAGIAENQDSGGGGAPGGGGGSGGGSGGFSLSDLPIERFRMVFYHSTIVQSFGSGMLAGYLKTNDVRSGLKFAVVLSTISTVVFAVL